MKSGICHKQRCFAAARTLALLLLVSAVLAPKISLAVVATVGSGYSSVIICTGGGLVRVSLSPQGEIVDDISEAWVSAHCVPQDERTTDLQRAWHRTGFPRLVEISAGRERQVSVPRIRSLRTVSNRGPPILLIS